MKIDRLFGIVIKLLNSERVTAKMLAEQFEVSERTIYRDIESLSLAGIPIYCINGKNGGIEIMDSFSLNKMILSKDEQQKILFAVQSMKLTDFEGSSTLISKLGSLFNMRIDNSIEIDMSSWDEADEEKFQLIHQAIVIQKIIKFTYFNTSGEKSIRTIEPYKLLFKGSSWYLIAYCLEKQDYRFFKLHRIKDLSYTEEVYKVREDYLLKTKDILGNRVNTIKIVLQIDKAMSYRVYDEFGENQYHLNDAGDFIVELNFPEDEWLYGYVLSFGEHLRVLSPERFKGIIEDKLKKSVNNYS